MKTFTVEEVARHNTQTDMWLIIDHEVWDISKFAKFHPGGIAALMPYAGKEATEAFFGLHRIAVLDKYRRFRIGKIAGKESHKSSLDRWDPAAPSEVPYSEANFLQGLPSPYYDESHIALRNAVAQFREKELMPVAEMHEKQGKAPSIELYQKMGKAGILLTKLGPGPWLKEAVEEWGIKLPGNVPHEKFNYFHELMCHEQMVRVPAVSFLAGLGDGYVIGLPAVLHFGKGEVRKRVAKECILGNKRICLAITEPQAGSDVANIVTSGKRTPDKKHFIVNGTKKWITNGDFADYFVTAVRTGGKGMFGVTMMLIERSECVITKHIETAYGSSSGVALVEFRNAKVPVENVLGNVNQGFRCIMYNFNHERWMICAQVLGSMRAVQTETMKWSMQRKAFGKTLMQQPVVRQKFAKMFSTTESMWAWMEQITHAMNTLPFDQQMVKLAGPLALLKYQLTRAAWTLADECAQIFGGRAITKSGMGVACEQYLRTVKYGAILGGSEEVMADLGVRQAQRAYPKHAKL